MNKFVNRATLHSVLLCALCAGVIVCSHKFPHIIQAESALLIVSIVAIVNIIGEIVLAKFTKAETKDSIFKIMVIRTTKFLVYLVLTIPFVWYSQNQIANGLLILFLFGVYAVVEFSFFGGR